MGFLLTQLQQLGMVAIIMVCALGGTIGIIKLIRRFTWGKGFQQGPAVKRPDESGRKPDERGWM